MKKIGIIWESRVMKRGFVLAMVVTLALSVLFGTAITANIPRAAAGSNPIANEYDNLVTDANWTVEVAAGGQRDRNFTPASLHFRRIITIPNPNPAAGDCFGDSVAISGNKILVGAPGADLGATDAGAAYLYEYNSTSCVLIDTIVNPTPDVGDMFGSSVAISGTKVVIGAPWDDVSNGDAGVAYVYNCNPACGSPITILNPRPDAGDRFGSSVAISGTKLVIGAPWDEDPSAGSTNLNTGSVYVYDCNPTCTLTDTINNPAMLNLGPYNNPTAAISDWFGSSVAISGTKIVVSAPGDDVYHNSVGSVYVYDCNPTSVLIITIGNPTPDVDDMLGSSVAISGTKVVVGTGGDDDSGAPNAGSAYLFPGSLPIEELPNPTPAASDGFGVSVAISETKSSTLVVVGAPLDDTGILNAGAAYVYQYKATCGSPTTIQKPTPATGDYFGDSVAISGKKILVGAPRDDLGATDAGAAYLFVR